jgi:cytochrome c553
VCCATDPQVPMDLTRQARRPRWHSNPPWLHASAAVVLLALAGPSFAASAEETAKTLCAACHGPDGNSVAPTFPRLAGLQREYIAKQLDDFRAGRRMNETMAPIAAALDPGLVKELAAWFAARKPAPGPATKAALLELGKAIYMDGNPTTGVPSCSGCHEEDGTGSSRYPRLAGQHQAYTVQQMLLFKSGARTNDRGSMMRSLSERMTEAEIAAVAEYIAGM